MLFSKLFGCILCYPNKTSFHCPFNSAPEKNLSVSFSKKETFSLPCQGRMRLLLLALLLTLSTSEIVIPEDRCTTIVVGKKAGVEGPMVLMPSYFSALCRLLIFVNLLRSFRQPIHLTAPTVISE